jgi:hypothetical protein
MCSPGDVWSGFSKALYLGGGTQGSSQPQPRRSKEVSPPNEEMDDFGALLPESLHGIRI